MHKQYNEKSHFGPRDLAPVRIAEDQAAAFCQNYQDLANYGIGLDSENLAKMASYAGMDAALAAPVTTASITTPVQFLQAWLPGFVYDITDVRRIDNLVGITTQGEWHDEEIVQGVMERTGTAAPYTDYGNTKQAGWNLNYERRTIVRHEIGITVGRLEEARASAVRANAAEAKRGGSSRELEIIRNNIGFNGYNAGANRTYGFLNDPMLPAYVNAPNGAGGSSEWSTKNFQEIKNDILAALQALRVQSGERVDPKSDMITLAVATSAVDYMTQATDFGVSVMEWLNKNYGNVRVESAPELDDANASDSVFYLYAETVKDSGTDDNRTFIQVVPTKFQTLGVDQQEKSYSEAYSNATSGIMLKRPYAVVRYSGI